MSIQNAYEESKKYSEDILRWITEGLSKDKIEYTEGSDEIVIVSKDQSKDTITEWLNDNIKCEYLWLLIDVTEIDDVIYIRQITK